MQVVQEQDSQPPTKKRKTLTTGRSSDVPSSKLLVSVPLVLEAAKARPTRVYNAAANPERVAEKRRREDLKRKEEEARLQAMHARKKRKTEDLN